MASSRALAFGLVSPRLLPIWRFPPVFVFTLIVVEARSMRHRSGDPCLAYKVWCTGTGKGLLGGVLVSTVVRSETALASRPAGSIEPAFREPSWLSLGTLVPPDSPTRTPSGPLGPLGGAVVLRAPSTGRCGVPEEDDDRENDMSLPAVGGAANGSIAESGRASHTACRSDNTADMTCVLSMYKDRSTRLFL